MKDEATAYYSSLTGVCDQQKERLKDIQSKMKSVVASVDTTLQDNDQSFLMKMESTFERIYNLQKKFQAVSLTVPKPWLIKLRNFDAKEFQQIMKTKWFFCKPPDVKMCFIDSSSYMLHVGEQTLFTLTLCDSSGNISVGENDIEINLLHPQGCSIIGEVEPLSQGHMKVILTPTERGQHQLNVKVNGAHIKNSPFTVTVYIPLKSLSKPVTMISGLRRPASLRCLQDKVLATEMNNGRIIEFDSRLHVVKEFTQLSGPGELTQDLDFNIYATSTHHQLVKLSSTGSIIKVVGQLGKGNAEFNVPNGLRIKNCELYVCDTKNNRLQVFDLDLNFKRSFGKKGKEKGQFELPVDVNFDASGNIYVTEQTNYRIQVFTHTEQHIRSIGNIIQRFQPVSLLIHNEILYVTDGYNHKVWVMNTSGDIITTFGDGYLYYPEGITMDKDGFVYVTSHYSKIVVF